MTKATPDLRSLARSHTEMCVQTLAGLARNATSDQVRLAAAEALLSRGWGKPPEVHSDADGGPIRVIIRQISDVTGGTEPVLIEHKPDHGSR
jgi:hypothetical protein